MDIIPRTVRGRIARKDEMTTTKSGRKVLRFAVAENSSYRNGAGEWVDREAVFTRCEAWADFAERIDAELNVGSPVSFTGEPRARTFETEDKQKRTTQWVAVFAGGPDLSVKPSKAKATDEQEDTTQPPESKPTTSAAAESSDPFDE